LINESAFFKMNEDWKGRTGVTEEKEGTKMNDEQKPEFDTYGTALNEL
jgi:hypothetical protein